MTHQAMLTRIMALLHGLLGACLLESWCWACLYMPLQVRPDRVPDKFYLVLKVIFIFIFTFLAVLVVVVLLFL
jgi:hypothetical protein